MFYLKKYLSASASRDDDMARSPVTRSPITRRFSPQKREDETLVRSKRKRTPEETVEEPVQIRSRRSRAGNDSRASILSGETSDLSDNATECKVRLRRLTNLVENLDEFSEGEGSAGPAESDQREENWTPRSSSGESDNGTVSTECSSGPRRPGLRRRSLLNPEEDFVYAEDREDSSYTPKFRQTLNPKRKTRPRRTPQSNGRKIPKIEKEVPEPEKLNDGEFWGGRSDYLLELSNAIKRNSTMMGDLAAEIRGLRETIKANRPL